MTRRVPVNRQAGSTLGVVMCVLATIMVIAAVAVYSTTLVGRNVQRSNTEETALSVADSCIEILFANWRDIARRTGTGPPKTSQLSGTAIPTPSPGQFPNLPPAAFVKFAKRGVLFDPKTDEPPGASDYDGTYTISNYKVIAVTPEETAYPSATTQPTPALGQDGISKTYNYIASADVTLSGLGPQQTNQRTGGNVVVKVRRVFQRQDVSPWSYAIFYADPLEIHPGPQFVVNGWVHTNSDLYTGHNTLTFSDKVSYSGDWNIGFMPGDGDHPETPASPNYPGSPDYPSNLPNAGQSMPPVRSPPQQPFGIDPTSQFSTTDSNPNNDSYHELIDPPAGNPLPSKNPASQYYDPLLDGQNNWTRYYDQAGIVIQVSDNPSSTTPGWDGVNGHDLVNLYVVNQATAALTPISNASPNNNGYKDLYNMFATSGAITTNQSIQDNREGANVGITTLDVSKIVNTTGPNPSYNDGNKDPLTNNPVVYIYNKSATSSARRGIRIKGGSVIPSAGLTVASANPVYIQGDFNTGGTGSAVPSNNSSNLNSNGTYANQSSPPDPQVSGYSRGPCSVVADAVNILSNSWVDGSSNYSTPASPTTVNTAIISGNVPTNTYGDNAYSGGAENFPRFLENWSNMTFTYYGSMVELFQSQQATGEWGKPNVYSPPAREWFFDDNFKTTPPPGSIMIYNYIKGRWSLL